MIKLCSLEIPTLSLLTKILKFFWILSTWNVFNQPTYLQSENWSCIHLILTNKKELYKHSEVNQIGIPTHHSFVVTSSKTQLVKDNAKTKVYRHYSKINMNAFKKYLGKSLTNKDVYKHTFSKYICLYS